MLSFSAVWCRFEWLKTQMVLARVVDGMREMYVS
jgi:hypothetical protein